MFSTLNTINAGVIGCDLSEDFFQTSGVNNAEKFHWKKAYPGDKEISGKYQRNFKVEIVDSVDAIANDKDITLVFISSKNLPLAKPILEAGKSVRII